MDSQPPDPKPKGNKADAASTLRELLAADIERFDTESTKHKTIHRRGELVVIVTTALTTVIAGLGLVVSGRENQIQYTVLVLSALSTAVTSWAASRRARDLWQHEREVYYALKDILRELDFREAAAALDLHKIQELFDRSASVLGSSTAKWSRILSRKLPQPTEP